MVKPETGQANRSENKIRSGPLLSWIFAVFFAAASVRPLPCGGGSGRGAAADAGPRGLPPPPRFPPTSPPRGGGANKVGEGGGRGRRPAWLTPLPALRADLPHKGGGDNRRRGGRIGVFDHGEAVGEFQRGLKALGQALADVGAHHDAVDHHVDVMGKFL